ncbi:hypothetical protein VRU48_12015 [Pedobacter sp. KR3-3]|uniref:Uncharacterized protein n=1 Tax=Pedobacter albus TaxID=3113905 RepID=A0ABU7I8P7_9SPHI|nr:hypothetical protein [Pedobacter sp. KR3-3]MEE1945837.1 hypothetical protein [Pedobacter sp. KR3-3]
MKRILVAMLLLSMYVNVFAQTKHLRVLPQTSIINVNDTAYLRVLDGIIIDKSYQIKAYERASIRQREDLAHFENKGNKRVMIIGLEVSDLESKIDSVLYSRPTFIETYKYPLDIRLPISINNKLLSNDQKQQTLAKLTLEKIKKIEYLANNNPKVNPKITPYGVINLKTE